MVTTFRNTQQQLAVRQSALTTGLAAIVGNTPLLPLHRLAADYWPEVQVYATAEWFNPGGSVKDRPALCILRAALEEGKLTPGKRLLDSTSGNMGIAYATLAASIFVFIPPVLNLLPLSPALRTICSVISKTVRMGFASGNFYMGFATGLLGFAQVYWDANRQAIHDRICGTVVVLDGAEKVLDWEEAL